MKPEHARLLLECSRRMCELASTPRPEDWQTWLVDEYDEQVEHGPRYGCGEWFGPHPEHQRMRYRRAIDELERGGLLITWRRWGRRLSNLRLTRKGKALVTMLLGEAVPISPSIQNR